MIDGETVIERNCGGPVLGAFADASWELEQTVLQPGQQLVIVTDGIAEACGQGGRFGDERIRSELGGAGSPVQVVQRLEGALQAFTGGVLEDDVAILALSPDAPEGRPTGESRSPPPSRWPARPGSGRAMDEGARTLIERLFDAFNRRDPDEIVALCDERMEFFAVTAEEAGHGNPYVGTDGLRAYLDDVATVWEDLLITPTEVEQAGDAILVRGRVYLRSRALGIRDMPTAWIWELERGPLHPRPGVHRPGGSGRALQPRSADRAASRSGCIEIDDSTPVIFSSR